MKSKVCEVLKSKRKAMGMTQADFAHKVGVSFRSYCDYETGKTAIPSDKLEDIAEALGLSVADLYLLALPPPKTKSLKDLTDPEIIDAISEKIAQKIQTHPELSGPLTNDLILAWPNAGQIERILALLVLTGNERYLHKLPPSDRKIAKGCMSKLDKLCG